MVPGSVAGHRVFRYLFGSSVPVLIISIIYRNVLNMMRADREKLSTELKFLRSQINPHFLFNILTNMVSLARQRSDKLEPALIQLSDMMRYMLYDTQGRKIPLEKEIAYLQSYISLQQLRFGNDVMINSEITTNADQYTIEPMLLIPFIENAFKHGSAIHVKLEVRQDALFFEVVNQYTQQDGKDESSGIGLQNVRSRLELLYKRRHTLQITDQQNRFHITLKLQLT